MSARQISKEINSNFNTEAEDIFQDSDEAIKFVAPLERFFVKSFYNNKTINDNDIYNALIKVYSYQINNAVLASANNCEELILKEFSRIDKKFRDIPKDIKAKSILKLSQFSAPILFPINF